MRTEFSECVKHSCHTFVKVCGVTRPEDVSLLLDLGVDRLGLVFYPESPRYVTQELAYKLVHVANKKRLFVMVTVDMPLKRLLDIYDSIQDYTARIQLHGHESCDYLQQLRSALDQRVNMRPEIVRRVTTSQERDDYLSFADKLLWEPRGRAPGGNGVLSSLQDQREFQPAERFIIAGGITADNVIDVLTHTRVGEIDVCSGTESRPGIKSEKKIRALMQNVRQYDQIIFRRTHTIF